MKTKFFSDPRIVIEIAQEVTENVTVTGIGIVTEIATGNVRGKGRENVNVSVKERGNAIGRENVNGNNGSVNVNVIVSGNGKRREKVRGKFFVNVRRKRRRRRERKMRGDLERRMRPIRSVSELGRVERDVN